MESGSLVPVLDFLAWVATVTGVVLMVREASPERREHYRAWWKRLKQRAAAVEAARPDLLLAVRELRGPQMGRLVLCAAVLSLAYTTVAVVQSYRLLVPDRPDFSQSVRQLEADANPAWTRASEAERDKAFAMRVSGSPRAPHSEYRHFDDVSVAIRAEREGSLERCTELAMATEEPAAYAMYWAVHGTLREGRSWSHLGSWYVFNLIFDMGAMLTAIAIAYHVLRRHRGRFGLGAAAAALVAHAMVMMSLSYLTYTQVSGAQPWVFLFVLNIMLSAVLIAYLLGLAGWALSAAVGGLLSVLDRVRVTTDDLSGYVARLIVRLSRVILVASGLALFVLAVMAGIAAGWEAISAISLTVPPRPLLLAAAPEPRAVMPTLFSLTAALPGLGLAALVLTAALIDAALCTTLRSLQIAAMSLAIHGRSLLSVLLSAMVLVWEGVKRAMVLLG
jgi:hypothetical protein